MPDIADDPITRLAFSVQQNKGVYALLLGSGLSLSAGILTGWGVTLNLIEKLARNQGVTDQPDWYLWYKETYGKEPDYSTLLKKIAPKPAERQPIIQAYLSPERDPDDPEDRTGLPTPAHQAIARLVKAGHIKVIVTTNFDRLLETALSAEGIQPTIIASADQCNGAIPLPHSACTILKLHGDVLDVRSLNTADELARYPKKIDRLLDRILDEYGLIIAGWSGVWDHALRAAILRTPSRRYSTWWTAYQGQIAPEAVALADHRQAERISINGADGFFQELEVKVETFARLKTPPPATTALVVAMAKRYLQRPEHRIDLADLVQRETVRLLADMAEILANAPKQSSDPTLRISRDQCESAVEALAAVLGTIGRWGSDDPAAQHLGLAPDTIRLCLKQFQAPTGGYLFLAAYPPLYLFHAYGLGLVQARRWTTLWDFLLLPLGERQQWPVSDRGSGPLRMVEAFLLRWWLPLQVSGNGDYSFDLTGRQGDGDVRTAYVTDHVWNRLQSWLPHFLGDLSDVTVLHERFLVYAAYALFAGRPERTKAPQGIPIIVPMAVPYIASKKFETLIAELNDAANTGNGFGPQDVKLFEEFKYQLDHSLKQRFNVVGLGG